MNTTEQEESMTPEDRLRLFQSNAKHLISVFSHHFAGSLSAIQMGMSVVESELSKIIADSQTNATLSHTKEITNMLQSSLHRLLKLQQDLLLLLRLQLLPQPKPLQPQETVQLAQLLSVITSIWHEKMEAADLTVETNIIETNLITNKTMIETIIKQLVSNAFRFTANHGTIRISCSQDDSKTVITIENHSPAVRPGLIDQVQSGNSITATKPIRGEAGSGLGLLIATTCCKLIDAELRLSQADPFFQAELSIPLQ